MGRIDMLHTPVPAVATLPRRRSILAILAACTAAAFPASSQTPSFSDQTVAAGVSCTQTSPLGPETNDFLGGAAAGDFDDDGWQDLFVPMCGSAPDKLFMNNRDGTFSDQAGRWGIATTHIGSGMAVGDYDNDGHLDMYVVSHGTGAGYLPGKHKLYHNNGQSFTNVAQAAGVHFSGSLAYDGFGAAFGDSDLDGDLDLFVSGWQIQGFANSYFLNDADGTFTRVTNTHIAAAANLGEVRGFSPLFVDMNDDFYPELLIVADFGTSRYLVNNGDGTYVDATSLSGTGLDEFGMGGCVADFNADGMPDWYVTSIYGFIHLVTAQGNKLYRNEGGHSYSELSGLANVNDGGWGWGTVAVDFNHDTFTDIAETNGWFQLEWVGENDYLWMSNGPSSSFTEMAVQAGIVHASSGKGMLHFDYDRDGDQDLVVASNDGPLTLFRNDISGPDTHWLRVTLDNRGASHIAPNGYGAKVEVTVDGVTQVKSMNAGGSFLSQCELVCHFGLGAAATVDRVRITWPDGTIQQRLDVPADQTLDFKYGPQPGWRLIDKHHAPGTGPVGPPITQ